MHQDAFVVQTFDGTATLERLMGRKIKERGVISDEHDRLLTTALPRRREVGG